VALAVFAHGVCTQANHVEAANQVDLYAFTENSQGVRPILSNRSFGGAMPAQLTKPINLPSPTAALTTASSI
jgi:hypothetical protein